MFGPNLFALALNLAAGQTPDVLDLFKTDPSANVLLLLDSSCSMGAAYGRMPSSCGWFASTYNGGNTNLSKNDMVKASLIGCTSSTDGILDRWGLRMNFAIWNFGGTVGQLAPFGSTLTALQSAVSSLPASGGTPMSQGLRDSGNYLKSAFNDSTHPTCRKDYVVMMSDGEPNGGGSTFNYECTAPVENVSVGATEPWVGARYLYRDPDPSTSPRDSLCTVNGTQPIRSYTVGFKALEDFNEYTLQEIARQGDGRYFLATDLGSLSTAFDQIVTSIASRGYVAFSAPSVQTTGLFADNYVYATAFKPASGLWPGTLKKYCVNPPKRSNGLFDTTVTNCVFRSTDGHNLLTNTNPQDLFTYISSTLANVGGTGEVLFDQLGSGPSGAPVSPYWSHRNIYTWRDNGTYVPVNPVNWGSADTWANGCDHYKLINFLHGYTWDANCSTGNPIALRDWTLGAAINTSPVLLKYGACHNSADVPQPNTCFVAVGMNDGMLHIVDAATGDETYALVPAELWKMNRVSTNMMDQVIDQPTSSMAFRYFIDGDMRLLHDDANGNGIIDNSEEARLVFGLGRGGNAYYQIKMNRLTNGILNATDNPIYPLSAKRGTAYEELHETWHAPYFGRARVNNANYRIAAFGSGHIHTLDDPAATLGVQPAGMQAEHNLTTINNVACSGTGNFAAYNGLASNGTTLCTLEYKPSCAGTRTTPCYDTGYWATNPATAVPMNVQLGPLKFKTSTQRGAAYRVRFDRFVLGPGDRLDIKDGRGKVHMSYSGSTLDHGVSGWLYDEEGLGFYLNFVTNGIDSAHIGWSILSIDWVPVADEAVAVSVPAHNPTLYVLDDDKWNGTSPRSFTGPAAGSVLIRAAKSCLSSDTGTCLDASTVPALANLVCPITGEVSAYNEGDTLRALYFGTECGEIWKLFTNDGGISWSVKRLLTLNTPGRTGASKDFRKIFRRLDIVPTACPGARAVGVYFGTGNEQRPQARDELADTTLNTGRDIVGVLWDDGNINEQRIGDLQDISSAAYHTVDARTVWSGGKKGWYFELGNQERMLRDPLVFEGVSYYKTRQPTTSASECSEGDGLDRVYAVDNCNGDAIRDSNADGSITNAGDRQVWTGSTDIGGNLLVFTPKNEAPIISVAPTDENTNARLNPTRTRNIPRVFQWRQPTREP